MGRRFEGRRTRTPVAAVKGMKCILSAPWDVFRLGLAAGRRRLAVEKNDTFVFDRPFFDDTNYEVIVEKHPFSQTCSLDDTARGVFGGKDVRDVRVICEDEPLQVEACRHSRSLKIASRIGKGYRPIASMHYREEDHAASSRRIFPSALRLHRSSSHRSLAFCAFRRHRKKERYETGRVGGAQSRARPEEKPQRSLPAVESAISRIFPRTKAARAPAHAAATGSFILRCLLSQNSEEFPNKRDSRNAIAGVTALRSFRSSLMV